MNELGLYRLKTSRGLLGIRRMDKVPNSQTWQLCRVMKGVNEKIDEGISPLLWSCGEDGEQQGC